MKECISGIEKEKINLERFASHFKEGSLALVGYESLPDFVRSRIEKKIEAIKRNNNCNVDTGNHCGKITYAEGAEGYISVIRKIYAEEQRTEESVFLFDTKGQEISGFSLLEKEKGEGGCALDDEPFESFTSTDEKFRGEGLGRRRTLVLNALSQAIYKKPLLSDSVMLDQVKKIWQRLEKEGLAERIGTEERERYRFIGNNNQ